MLYRVTVETEVDGRQYTTELSLPNLLTVVNVASRWARVPQSFARQYHIITREATSAFMT